MTFRLFLDTLFLPSVIETQLDKVFLFLMLMFLQFTLSWVYPTCSVTNKILHFNSWQKANFCSFQFIVNANSAKPDAKQSWDNLRIVYGWAMLHWGSHKHPFHHACQSTILCESTHSFRNILVKLHDPVNPPSTPNNWKPKSHSCLLIFFFITGVLIRLASFLPKVFPLLHNISWSKIHCGHWKNINLKERNKYDNIIKWTKCERVGAYQREKGNTEYLSTLLFNA